jgi:fructokinase
MTPPRDTVVCLGEALIDFVADVSDVSLIDCPGFRKAPGGAPANVAVGLARLGVPVRFIGKVGDDPFGHFLEQTLAGAGVDTRGMRFDPEARTGLAFVALRADGEREFTFFRHPSADMRLHPSEIDPALFAGARLFHFGSITLITEPSRSATFAAVKAARAAGCAISYDPNLRLPLWPGAEEARREMLAAMPVADVVKVSDDEAVFLHGDPERCAEALLAQGPRLVLVTRGAAGCDYFTAAGARGHVAGFSVTAIDTTGAGDGFVAGLLAHLPALGGAPLPEEELREILRFANAVGALTCTQKGAIPALPTPAAVAALLGEAGKRSD